MTRPPQPAPYAGDLPVETAAPVPYRREYRDALGWPVDGSVLVMREDQSPGRRVPLQGGALVVQLPPGTYRLTAELVGRDGQYFYETATVTL